MEYIGLFFGAFFFTGLAVVAIMMWQDRRA